ncbi:MAG TPA: hypothetical protein VIK69_01480 [Methylophilaceae bacterium]|jgi:hypothetical protein
MLVLRLLLALGVIAVIVLLGAYFLTSDKRYLRYCWQLFKFVLVMVIIAAVLFVAGRIILL